MSFGRLGAAGAKNIMKGILAEEAFQLYLDEMKVKYDLDGRTTWHKIDQYDIAIDQVPLDLKSHFIDKNNPYYKKKLEEYPDIQTFIYDCICLIC